MSASTQNYESATNAVQLAASQIGRYFGGPFGQAYAMFLSGQGGLTGSLADLFSKIDDGSVTSEDVADVLYDAAAITAGFGVLVGLASPWVITPRA